MLKYQKNTTYGEMFSANNLDDMLILYNNY